MRDKRTPKDVWGEAMSSVSWQRLINQLLDAVNEDMDLCGELEREEVIRVP